MAGLRVSRSATRLGRRPICKPKRRPTRSGSAPACCCVRSSRIGCFRRSATWRVRASWPTRPSSAASTGSSASSRRCSTRESARRSSIPARRGSWKNPACAFETLQAQDEGALNRLLESLLAAGARADVRGDRTRRRRRRRPSQGGGRARSIRRCQARSTRRLDRIRETLKTLQGKIIQASKRKDETLRRQFHRTRALAFPGGQPQERTLCTAVFLARYGPALTDRLLEALPLERTNTTY